MAAAADAPVPGPVEEPEIYAVDPRTGQRVPLPTPADAAPAPAGPPLAAGALCVVRGRRDAMRGVEVRLVAPHAADGGGAAAEWTCALEGACECRVAAAQLSLAERRDAAACVLRRYDADEDGRLSEAEFAGLVAGLFGGSDAGSSAPRGDLFRRLAADLGCDPPERGVDLVGLVELYEDPAHFAHGRLDEHAAACGYVPPDLRPAAAHVDPALPAAALPVELLGEGWGDDPSAHRTVIAATVRVLCAAAGVAFRYPSIAVMLAAKGERAPAVPRSADPGACVVAVMCAVPAQPGAVARQLLDGLSRPVLGVGRGDAGALGAVAADAAAVFVLQHLSDAADAANTELLGAEWPASVPPQQVRKQCRRVLDYGAQAAAPGELHRVCVAQLLRCLRQHADGLADPPRGALAPLALLRSSGALADGAAAGAALWAWQAAAQRELASGTPATPYSRCIGEAVGSLLESGIAQGDPADGSDSSSA